MEFQDPLIAMSFLNTLRFHPYTLYVRRRYYLSQNMPSTPYKKASTGFIILNNFIDFTEQEDSSEALFPLKFSDPTIEYLEVADFIFKLIIDANIHLIPLTVGYRAHGLILFKEEDVFFNWKSNKVEINPDNIFRKRGAFLQSDLMVSDQIKEYLIKTQNES